MADTYSASETSEPPKQPELAADVLIRLQIGGCHFTTTKDTLTEESGFFASLLSGRWDNVLEDGSYFIDADPILFEHILRYLRRGVFPLFFDAAKGHDYHLYLSLLEEARYFQIPRLEGWLEKKRYLEAVQVVHTAAQHHKDTFGWRHLVVPADTTLEYHPHQGSEKVYVCPRRIPVHRGRPEACGRACEAARIGDDDHFEEEPTLRMLVIEKAVTFKPEVLRGSG